MHAPSLRQPLGAPLGSGSLAHRNDVDGLRGVAVLLVLIFHFDLFGIGKAGFIGVDIFFVISGYVITRSICGQFDSHSFSLANFYNRRIRRLAPPLIATQLIVLAAGYFIMMPSELIAFAKESIATQLYVSNIYYWRFLNYFAINAQGAVMLHTWSLSVEEQFYLIYPILLLGVRRFFPGRLFTVLIIVSIISFSLNILFLDRKPEAVFYLLPTRAWELLAGGLLATAEWRYQAPALLRAAAGPLGAAMIGIALVTYDYSTKFPGSFALLPVAGAVLLIWCGGIHGATHDLLACRPLLAIGKISYSLYLVHWPIKVLLPNIVFDQSIAWRWAGFFLSFLIAAALYFLVEKPIRIGASLRGNRGTFLLYGGTVALLVAVLGSAWSSAGWRDRFTPSVLALADGAYDFDERTRNCTIDAARSLPECTLGQPGRPREWIIVGDSHAQALAPAVDAWLRKRGEAGVLVYQHGCMPLIGIGSESCAAFAARVQSYWSAPEARRVFLISTWRQAIVDGLQDGSGHQLARSAVPDALEQSVSRTVNHIRSTGREVYVWQPLPAARLPVPTGLARAKALGVDADISSTLAVHRSEYKILADAFAAQKTRISGTVDPAAEICATGRCILTAGGRPIYYDAGHPAASQAGYYAAMLSRQLAAIP